MQYVWPHDDVKSLTAFYGEPWKNPGLIAHVAPPFVLHYQGAAVHAVQIHIRCAAALNAAFAEIWNAVGKDQHALDATGFSNYAGSFAYRNVRGSPTKLSCHAFAAALDFDDHANPRGQANHRIPDFAVKAFKNVGAYWGNDYIHSPKDPMHFQFARE